jgi:hypothetical protein
MTKFLTCPKLDVSDMRGAFFHGSTALSVYLLGAACSRLLMVVLDRESRLREIEAAQAGEEQVATVVSLTPARCLGRSLAQRVGS